MVSYYLSSIFLGFWVQNYGYNKAIKFAIVLYLNYSIDHHTQIDQFTITISS